MAIVAKKLRFTKVSRGVDVLDLDMQVRMGGRKEFLGRAIEVKERAVLILARQKRSAAMSLSILPSDHKISWPLPSIYAALEARLI
jgi:hypothetical protein